MGRELAPGSIVDGFEIRGLLGRGGMGAVYRAFRPGTGECALKTLEGAMGVEEVARFQREAELLAALRHPSIVPVHTAGRAYPGNFLYFAMGLVSGESLEARLKRAGPLDVHEACKIVLQVADAVAFAHEKGIVHRDLKPANILIEESSGHAYVTDFGLGRSLEDEQERLTRTGEVLGTPSYMAPEQAFGDKEKFDERVDVYGLGAILYAALSGRPPFNGATAVETLRKVRSTNPEPLPAGIPPAVLHVIERALSKKRLHRPPTARAFADELEAAFAYDRRRIPRWLVVGLAIAAGVCAGTTGAVVLKQRARLAEREEFRQTLDLAGVALSQSRCDAALEHATFAQSLAEKQDDKGASLSQVERLVALTHEVAVLTSNADREREAFSLLERCHARLGSPVPQRSVDVHFVARFLDAGKRPTSQDLDALARRSSDALTTWPLSFACRLAWEQAQTPEHCEQLLERKLPVAESERRRLVRVCLDALTRVKLADLDLKKLQEILKLSTVDHGMPLDQLEKTFAPGVRLLALARHLDPSLEPFPPEAVPLLARVRLMGGRMASQRDLQHDEAWKRIFARDPRHPSFLYVLARIEGNVFSRWHAGIVSREKQRELERDRARTPEESRTLSEEIRTALRGGLVPAIEKTLHALEESPPSLARDVLAEDLLVELVRLSWDDREKFKLFLTRIGKLAPDRPYVKQLVGGDAAENWKLLGEAKDSWNYAISFPELGD